MERPEYDLLFRWFVGIGVGEAAWDRSVFSKNRDRLKATSQPSCKSAWGPGADRRHNRLIELDSVESMFGAVSRRRLQWRARMGGAGDGEARRRRGGGLPPPRHRYQLLFRWRVKCGLTARQAPQPAWRWPTAWRMKWRRLSPRAR
jgi:Transposase domain (DUF772)